MLKKVIFIISLVFMRFAGWAQAEIKVTNPGVSINDNGENTPDPSAVFDVQSNSKGVIFPRLTEAQRDAISDPVLGLLVFNLDICAYQYWNGRDWINVGDFLSLTPPPIPGDFTATAVNQTTIELSWTDPNDDETGFEIYISEDDSSFSLLSSAAENVENFTVSNLIDGTEYFFKVQAINACVKGDFSATVSAITHYDFGNGLKTDGINDYAINTFSSTPFSDQTYSVSMWIRQNELKAGQGELLRYLLYTFDGGSHGFLINIKYNYPADGKVTVAVGTPGTSPVISETYNETTDKVHIVAIVKSTDAKIYVNGVNVSGITGSLFRLTSFRQILIGQSLATNHPDVTYGELQCIKNHEFTQSQIDKIYNNGNGSRYIQTNFSPSQMLFDYKFNESAGSSISDNSDNSFNLNQLNFTTIDIDKWVVF